MAFLQENWFFILIVLLMLGCHLWHPGHGGHKDHRKDGEGDRS